MFIIICFTAGNCPHVKPPESSLQRAIQEGCHVCTMLYSTHFQDSILLASFWCTLLFMPLRSWTSERKPAGSMHLENLTCELVWAVQIPCLHSNKAHSYSWNGRQACNYSGHGFSKRTATTDLASNRLLGETPSFSANTQCKVEGHR